MQLTPTPEAADCRGAPACLTMHMLWVLHSMLEVEMLLDTAGRTALVGHGLQHVRARGESGDHARQRSGRDAARAVVARVEGVLHADQVPLGPAPVRPATRPRARAHAPAGPQALLFATVDLTESRQPREAILHKFASVDQ